jgi:hypothetical protein
MVTRELSHTVGFDIVQLESSVTRLCQSQDSIEDQNMSLRPQVQMAPLNQQHDVFTFIPLNQRTENHSLSNAGLHNEADKMLAQAEELRMEFGFSDLLNINDFE